MDAECSNYDSGTASPPTFTKGRILAVSPLRRWRSLILLIAVAALLFAASHRHAQVTNAPAALPRQKSIVIDHPVDPDTLDPSDIASIETLNIARMIFGTLYVISPQGAIEPYLADSYQYSEDGKAITFKLHPGLRCEDGSPLTARDVAYTFDRAADTRLRFTGSPSGFLIPSLGYLGARVDDPLTVTLLLKKYNPIAVGLITEMLIMCRKPYEKMSTAQAATHPSATGPYRLAEWAHDDHIVLERNPNYTLPPATYDRVVWRVIPEGSTRSAELIAGGADIVTQVPADQIDAINASDTAHVESVSSIRRIYLGLNQKDKFAATPGGRAIRDPAVRRAMQYAVDVPTMCEALLRIACTRLATMVVPVNDHSGIPPYPYDPDRAEQLLDAAGYPRGKDGVRFSLTLQAPRGLYGNSNIALAIGQYLSDIGIKTDVQLLDPSVHSINVRKRDAGPLYVQGTGGSSWSALYDMSDLASPDSGTNYTNWNDPAFYDGWARIQQTRDPAEQQAIVNQMLEEFHTNGTWIMLYCQPDVYGVSNKIVWKPRADEIINFNSNPRAENPASQATR